MSPGHDSNKTRRRHPISYRRRTAVVRLLLIYFGVRCLLLRNLERDRLIALKKINFFSKIIVKACLRGIIAVNKNVYICVLECSIVVHLQITGLC